MRDDAWLKRRVLLTGLVTFAGFFVITGVAQAADLPDWAAVLAVLAFLALVGLPLMRPVRDELRERRLGR